MHYKNIVSIKWEDIQYYKYQIDHDINKCQYVCHTIYEHNSSSICFQILTFKLLLTYKHDARYVKNL